MLNSFDFGNNCNITQQDVEILCKLKYHLNQIFQFIVSEKKQDFHITFTNLKELQNYLLILQCSINGILNNRYYSKRELFYTYQTHFRNQEILNELIKQISYNLQIPRKQLRIISSTKGLVCGALFLENQDVQLDLLSLTWQGKGLNITEFIEEWQLTIYGKQILIVEKETIYFKLINEGSQQFFTNTVLITGKGYPCYATKRFIKFLSAQNSNIPIYYFGDQDPHGYDILCQYAFGNEMTKHEQNNIPQIQWLNINPIFKQIEVKHKYKLTTKEKLLLNNLISDTNLPHNWKINMNLEEKFEAEDYYIDNLCDFFNYIFSNQ